MGGDVAQGERQHRPVLQPVVDAIRVRVYDVVRQCCFRNPLGFRRPGTAEPSHQAPVKPTASSPHLTLADGLLVLPFGRLGEDCLFVSDMLLEEGDGGFKRLSNLRIVVLLETVVFEDKLEAVSLALQDSQVEYDAPPF
jgi:hypothetical protein